MLDGYTLAMYLHWVSNEERRGAAEETMMTTMTTRTLNDSPVRSLNDKPVSRWVGANVPRTSTSFERAIETAREYRHLVASNRIVEAGEARRTIEDLGVGEYVDGVYVIEERVRKEMGV